MSALWDTAQEWVKVGTMQIVSRFLSGEALNDPTWQKNAVNTLLGFAAYFIFTRQLVPTGNFTDRFRPVADDTVKVGTMMLVSRLLAGLALSDPAWQRASLATLLGFAAYQLIVRPRVPTNDWTSYKPLLGAVNDVLKVGTMLIVSHLLTGGNLLDPKWAAASVATIVGFTVFHMITSHILGLFENVKITIRPGTSAAPAPAPVTAAPAPVAPTQVPIAPPAPAPANA